MATQTSQSGTVMVKVNGISLPPKGYEISKSKYQNYISKTKMEISTLDRFSAGQYAEF